LKAVAAEPVIAEVVEPPPVIAAPVPERTAAEVARNRFMEVIGEAAGGSAFYVQVGANDGRMADPVFSIAKRNAWRGLLIEPHPTYFETLNTRYKRRNQFTLLQIGISDKAGVLPLYHLDNSLMAEFPRWVHGSASVDKSRVERQVRLACKKSGRTYDPAMVAQTDVPMRRLDEVLAEQAITVVDLIVIDVEGHELAVMASADLTTLSLRGMLVECNGKNAVQKPEYVAALNAAGLIVYELRDDLCAFDPARLSVDLAAEFDAAGLPRLGK
jgi:FkbM family methyltransferase